MEAINCPRCGRLFTQIKGSICPVCEKEEEETFTKLKTYIDDNPNCTITELSEATEVKTKRILRFIKEGRLEISQGMKGEVSCELCGRPITHGRYCNLCIIRMSQDMADAFKVKERHNDKENGSRMHISSKKL